MTRSRTELFSGEFFADPFSFYAELRENDPVSWDERYEMWLVTRYDDVNALIRRPQLFSNDLSLDARAPNPRVRDEDAEALALVDGFRAEEFIQKDPPEHTGKRKPVARRFSPREMEKMRPVVRAVVAQLFDDVIDRGRADLVTEIARPLPLRVINELMGIASPDRGAVAEQARKRMASVLTLDDERMAISAEGFAETAALLVREIDERRQPSCPARDDVLADIATAEIEAVYSREESLANAMLIIDAGHETTVQLVCNSTLALLGHPEEWERLTRDPDRLVDSATEESLRFDPPLHAFRRIVAQDVELGGRRLRAGDRIHGVIASANRDSDYFLDPDRFDIERSPNSHLAFGAGAHYCLGQYLARMEGQEYLRALARRMPRLRLASDDIRYAHAPRVRSVTSLPVAWD
jgi:cytochrome P450